AIDQGRDAVIGVEVEQVLGKLAGLDAHDVDADAFFGQHDPRAMTPRVIGRGKQRHDGTSARQISAPAIHCSEPVAPRNRVADPSPAESAGPYRAGPFGPAAHYGPALSARSSSARLSSIPASSTTPAR